MRPRCLRVFRPGGRGCRAAIASMLGRSPGPSARRAIGVSMNPGGIVLTVMPLGAFDG